MSELVKEVSEVVGLFTTRYQKTREAREAKEPINFNCYNVELPISVVVHYPYGTLAADVREFHGLEKNVENSLFSSKNAFFGAFLNYFAKVSKIITK